MRPGRKKGVRKRVIMLDRFPRVGVRWVYIAVMTVALLVVACGSSDEPAAAPTLDVGAIQAAVAAGVEAASTDVATAEEIEALISKAVQEAAMAAAQAALLAVPTAAPVVRVAPVAGAAGQRYGGTVKIGVVDFGTMDPALMGLS